MQKGMLMRSTVMAAGVLACATALAMKEHERPKPRVKYEDDDCDSHTIALNDGSGETGPMPVQMVDSDGRTIGTLTNDELDGPMDVDMDERMRMPGNGLSLLGPHGTAHLLGASNRIATTGGYGNGYGGILHDKNMDGHSEYGRGDGRRRFN